MALSEDQKARETIRRAKQFSEYIASPNYQEKLIQRLQHNEAGNIDARSRAYIWHLCESPDDSVAGIKYFINNFCYTFSPKTDPKHLPFFTFDFQDDVIRWMVDKIEGKKDGLVEKSREMGASWLIFVVIPLWYWLFRDGINILIGSYKETLVDDRTDDSLFGKIDYAMAGLPTWMMPKGYNPNKHRTKLKLRHPNGNLISGDTMNPLFGRGARKTAVLFDELGFWEYAKDAWEGTSDTTDCRIANSTPHGYNFYAYLREETGIDVLTLLWKLHPLKDEEWYAFESARRSEEELAQEIDISYSKSREGKVYPEWNEDNITRSTFPYDPSMPLFVGWDFGKTDDTAIIWCQPQNDGRLRIIDVYKNTGKNIDFYVPFITGVTPSDGYKYSEEDFDIIKEHRNWAIGTHFGDPAGRFQNQVTDRTVLDVLREHGIMVNFRDQWKYHTVRKSAAKRLIMDGIDLNKNKRSDWFNITMINSSYPKIRREGNIEIWSEKPKHDIYSHYRSAFEYLALGLEGHHTVHRNVYDKFPKKDKVDINRRGARRSLGY